MSKTEETIHYLLVSEKAARERAESLHQSAIKETHPLIFEALKRASFDAMAMALEYKSIRLTLENAEL